MKLRREVFLLCACIGILFLDCFQQYLPKQDIGYDNDGMLILNGKRTFILGTYHLPKIEKPLEQLAHAGFNFVRAEADSEKLDRIHQAGLNAWISLNDIEFNDWQDSKKKIKERVAPVKDHPALVFWESAEKPAWTWQKAEPRIEPQPLINCYHYIKSVDPKHLIFMNHAPTNLRPTIEQYNPATDAVGCSVFPIISPNTPLFYGLFDDGLPTDYINPYISQMGSYTEKMRKIARGEAPVFMVQQAFAWENLRPEGPVDSLVRYPTHYELRFMAYDAIINQANGIIYWGLDTVPANSPFWEDLKKVVFELATIRDVLAAPVRNIRIVNFYVESGHSVDLGVEILVKKSYDSYYLIAANGDKNPVKVRISGFGRDKKAEVLFEHRTIHIENREITDTFEPFGVHVYKLINE